MMLSAQERFAAHVEKDPATGCWNWIGTRSRGYGRFMVDGRTVQAHRWAFEQAHGRLAHGLLPDHTCCNGQNRACCNPAHMEAVTYAENSRRGWARLSAARRAARIAASTAKATAAAAARRRPPSSPRSHCGRGHPLEGRPQCRTCARDRQRASRARLYGEIPPPR